MTVSDKVRNYCLVNIINPARARGEYGVFIKSGDVHTALKLVKRLPLVCSALGANEFEALANVRRVNIIGPLNASNTVFVFIF